MSEPTLYRLIWDDNAPGKPVLSLAPGSGVYASAKYQSILAPLDRCNAEITRRGLTPLPDPALAAAKTAKLAALAQAFGQPVTVSGVTLGTDAATLSLLNHFVTALQFVLSQQPDDTHRAALEAANVSTVLGPLLDAEGAPHDMTVAAGLLLMLGYIQAYGAARAAYLANCAAVNAATTVAAVEAVS